MASASLQGLTHAIQTCESRVEVRQFSASVTHQAALTLNNLESMTYYSYIWTPGSRYASREEQASAWKQGHKEECKALQRLIPRVPGPTVRLMARVLWKRCPSLTPLARFLTELVSRWTCSLYVVTAYGERKQVLSLGAALRICRAWLTTGKRRTMPKS